MGFSVLTASHRSLVARYQAGYKKKPRRVAGAFRRSGVAYCATSAPSITFTLSPARNAGSSL